jgi:anti-sigma-K factor RskA
MNCEEARELLDAHSLGALDRSEARRLEKQLAGCQQCRGLQQEAAEAATLLALAAPLRRASPAIRLRLRQRLAPRPALRWFPAPRLSWATGAAALVAVSVGALTWGGSPDASQRRKDNGRFAVLYDELDRRGETVDVLQKALTDAAFGQEHLQNLLEEQDQAMRVVALGGEGQEYLVGTLPASEAKGRYMWSPEEGLGVLFLINLPQLRSDETYQLWVTREGGSPVSGGTFTPQDDGSARLIVRTGDLQPPYRHGHHRELPAAQPTGESLGQR